MRVISFGVPADDLYVFQPLKRISTVDLLYWLLYNKTWLQETGRHLFLRNDKCVGFGAKLTLTADEEDDKSIYNNRDDAEEPAENPNHIYIVLNYSVVFASELFCCLLTTPFEEKPLYLFWRKHKL